MPLLSSQVIMKVFISAETIESTLSSASARRSHTRTAALCNVSAMKKWSYSRARREKSVHEKLITEISPRNDIVISIAPVLLS